VPPIATLEKRQGLKVSCPEEIAWRQGWLSDSELKAVASKLGKSGYGKYLKSLLNEEVF
jgi:glucose-1-phosphate thymidylyltransferase